MIRGRWIAGPQIIASIPLALGFGFWLRIGVFGIRINIAIKLHSLGPLEVDFE